MSKTLEYSISTSSRTELVNIDHLIREAIAESGVKDGICCVFVPHTTAGIIINENTDPNVAVDILKELNKTIPFNDHYAHVEGNSAAHIKSSLVGCSISIIIENGRPKFGTWQSVFFCEFDGPRRRKVWIKVL
ncbi:MAG: secondary thiamine-phosphate synthase enzyme YjbQ [candidate division KSB1 bacterium]|nr:secondary thiamine-phosphate synthase enzyme YjbQ [candidate division KSB1 bacterium]MDZ7336570.1 secondary thiamine-phosphate synthase enzyme YjbQ [candidate division KSB1 bacterium]MDZ7358921.1 secondary thiamine-phosphate synthase enzyme YjbQ [candidate division KSB1 bacterium]MDZ7376917.1 secondary thiamine-phosphate synthase enzyme YjbQ [candidate division KSB1 bacterium]MDZ7402368.1 secondary thiamine-phosphate synthase enzyme YjbQ [candidate division KSB1 bacterium]